MTRTVSIVLLLALCALLLGGCALPSPSSATLVGATATPIPTAAPTATPLAGVDPDAYDHGAGNCVDAANEAITLLGQVQNGRFGNTSFSMDMHLDLEPHDAQSGCATQGAALAHYRQIVSVARLSVYPLDTGWYYTGQPTRNQWLIDVINDLQSIYPNANVSIAVIYNGAPCGSASLGAGKGGARQIDPAPTCG